MRALLPTDVNAEEIKATLASRCAVDESARTMTGIYALISPDGSPEFREGVPDRMRKDADPRHGAPSAFTIQRSSWGRGGHGPS